MVLTQSVTKLENNWKTVKVARHSMQDLCSRICSFPTSIPAYFINNFTNEGDIVFDMWSGKGSVPFEALRNGRIGIGNDKSPEAYIMTHAKVRPISLEQLSQYLAPLRRKMDSVKAESEMTELDRKAAVFYSKRTFIQISKLRDLLMLDDTDEAIFVKAILMGLLHGRGSNALSLPCSHSYSMSPNYVRKYAKAHHLRRPSRDVIDCILNRAGQLYEDPLPLHRGDALNDDSTRVSLPSNYVHMILTSPPYFDTQTYAWCNWLRLWFLGHDYRKVRKTLAESGSVSKYREFMRHSIKELYRILKPGGRCFLVVGDVKVNGSSDYLNTAKFLAPSCKDAGFDIEKVVVDKIPRGRKVMTYVSEDNGIKKERILFLQKQK